MSIKCCDCNSNIEGEKKEGDKATCWKCGAKLVVVLDRKEGMFVFVKRNEG